MFTEEDLEGLDKEHLLKLFDAYTPSRFFNVLQAAPVEVVAVKDMRVPLEFTRK